MYVVGGHWAVKRSVGYDMERELLIVSGQLQVLWLCMDGGNLVNDINKVKILGVSLWGIRLRPMLCLQSPGHLSDLIEV